MRALYEPETMTFEKLLKLFSSRFLDYFCLANVALFLCAVAYYDVLEKPNAIGYWIFGLTIIISVIYSLRTGRKLNEIAFDAFVIGLIGVSVAHNINFIISFDYQEPFVIERKRPIASYREEWKVRLNDNRRITLIVSDDYSGDGTNVNLRKGIFGVYFGNWPE